MECKARAEAKEIYARLPLLLLLEIRKLKKKILVGMLSATGRPDCHWLLE